MPNWKCDDYPLDDWITCAYTLESIHFNIDERIRRLARYFIQWIGQFDNIHAFTEIRNFSPKNDQVFFGKWMNWNYYAVCGMKEFVCICQREWLTLFHIIFKKT